MALRRSVRGLVRRFGEETRGSALERTECIPRFERCDARQRAACVRQEIDDACSAPRDECLVDLVQ